MLGAGAVFTLLFVTLGPLKVLGPFTQRTKDMDSAALRGIAWRVFFLSLIVLVVGGFLGRALLTNWDIPVPVLLITGGIIFFLVALKLVMEQYEPVHSEPPPLPPTPLAAATQLTFPLVVTPYGIAALIALLAYSGDATRVELIFGLLLGVMVLNLLAMLYGRIVMHGVGLLALQLLGAVLGVLQVALAIQFVLQGLRDLGLVR